MKLYTLLLLISSLVFSSCNEDNNPTKPEQEPKFMLLTDYGSIIDTSYYKEWSDGSWEKFNRVLTLNGRTYVTVINNEGNEYYYDVQGYAGFQPSGESLIIFDHTLPSLPDTVVFNVTYSRQTSFFYGGYNFTMKLEQTFVDTVSVSVPFGIFNSCLWFKSKSTISASGQTETQNTQFWLAKGPSDIKATLNSGISIVMVKGVVNGFNWGMSIPEILITSCSSKENNLIKKIINTVVDENGSIKIVSKF